MTAFDHVGLSVRDLDAQAAWYAAALGLVPLPVTSNERLGLRARYLVDPDDGWALELLEHRESRPGLVAPSQMEAILTRGYGHICLRVADVAAAYEGLVAAGAASVSPPGPSPFSGLTLAYVADPESNLLEVIQRDETLQDRVRTRTP